MNPETLEKVLKKLAESGGLHGLENPTGITVGSDEFVSMIEKIAHKIGVIPIQNPEQPSSPENFRITDLQAIQSDIEDALGFKIGVPECFGYSVDKPTQVIPHRFFFYCAAAFTIKSRLAGNVPKDILEIGAGLGNLGWMARQWGCHSYTVVDLPSVCVMSSFFLSKCCGESEVWLFGEGSRKDQFCGFHPASNFSGVLESSYDVVFNSDSMPEMPESVRDGYINLIAKCLSPYGFFLSINHESNKDGQGRVFDSVRRNGSLKMVSRSPFMMREGYIEEIYCHSD